MKLQIQIGSRKRSVELAVDGDRVLATIDGQPAEADAIEVEPGVYSILLNKKAFEARVETRNGGYGVFVAGKEYALQIDDPRRWRRNGRAAADAAGLQQAVAPMPGKVVRVLAKVGEAVEAGQGLLVVEAMKMQNEVKSPKTGTVERLLVSEGQTVKSGEVLCVIA